MPETARRGPLRFIILAQTGQDIGKCTACRCCCLDEALAARFDLPLWKVMAAARRDSEVALTNRTIRLVAQASPEGVLCANDLNVVAVAQALCDEAEHRGLGKRVSVEG